MADDWKTDDVEALFEAILRLETRDETERFFRDLCTLERAARHGPALGGRAHARQRAPLRRDLADDRRQHGHDHPDRLVAQPRRRRLPRRCSTSSTARRAQGRPPTPSPAIDDPPPAPRDPQQGPARRADPAAAPRRRPGVRGARPKPRRAASRTTTSTSCSSGPTTSSSSSATAWPTSGSPASTSCPRPAPSCRVIRSLGYGRCRLAAAVPNDTPYRAVEDLAGLRVATAHPNTARRFFEERGIPVEIIPISGAVEVAPRLGLAEGIVDLVSTGSTLVMNGLRQIGDVLESEAILVANPPADRERAAELAADRHDAQRGDRRARPQVPDDERPGAAAARSSRRCSRRSNRRPSSRSPTPG